MPKRLDEELLSKIEKIYLGDNSETYSSLAERFEVGLSTLERVGKERNWARKRDQQKARRAEKIIKQSAIVSQSLERLDGNGVTELDQFSKRRIIKSVERGLLVFESVIDKNADNPRILASLAGGLTKLVEMHLKLVPPTAVDLVEAMIVLGITPQEFIYQLNEKWNKKNVATTPIPHP